jgi:hypothetical protein
MKSCPYAGHLISRRGQRHRQEIQAGQVNAAASPSITGTSMPTQHGENQMRLIC